MVRYLDKHILKKWRRRAVQAGRTSLPVLSDHRIEARKLKQALEDFLDMANRRIMSPYVGGKAFRVMHGTSWSWRPEIFRFPADPNVITASSRSSTLGKKIQFFHDCPLGAILVSQTRSTDTAHFAPFTVDLEVFDFKGSFVSMAINLPSEAIAGMVSEHIIRIEVFANIEREIPAFLRLKIQHGPNQEELVGKLNLHDQDMIEFDLKYTKIDFDRLEGAWFDIIVNDPAMNLLTIRDIRVSRRLRAEI